MLNIIILIIIIVLLFLFKTNFETFETRKYKYGILICCYNRPEYLEKTLESLKLTDLNDSIVYIIDDNSNNIDTINLIKNFDMPNVVVKKERNNVNLGITKSLEKGFTYLYSHCEYLTNLDSDVILKPNWLSALSDVHTEGKKTFPNAKNLIISGFNCTSTCYHKIQETIKNFHVKKTIGGVNTFFHKSFFKDYVHVLRTTNKNKNIGWDWNLCDYCDIKNIPILVSNPSVVQHIGFTGLNSDGSRADVAEDF